MIDYAKDHRLITKVAQLQPIINSYLRTYEFIYFLILYLLNQ